jgi:hypothetical protein
MATANITLSNVTTGAAGSIGYVTTGGGGGAYWTIPTTYANTPAYTNDVIIKREGKEDIHVAKTLEMLMDRLCIIQPAMDLIEKYPALREAYENYKMIETMVKNGNEDERL